ncbi:DUF6368 family protein [Kitasatospora sp. NPDC028055]|uniref:DUF6368 family protein n=1 Tax=Kitasatospora sp. NPDC028055 TaxID=3155653 RepID=UPI0033F19CCA
MGGPAAGLWLTERRSAVEAVPWLAEFCEIRAEGDDSVEFALRDPSVLGLPGLDVSSLCPFQLGPEPLDDDEYFGFPGLDHPPVTALYVVAYCSGRENHLALGHLVRFLAERFDALIDFNGLLGYCRPFTGLSAEEEAAGLAEARAFVSTLPGRTWQLPYATSDGGRWYGHIGDVEFLTAWLAHPEFRMVK